MKNNTLFKEFMTLIGEKYGQEISKSMAKLIWQALKPFPDAACEVALKDVLLHGRFYKDLLPDLMESLEESEEDRSIEAWLEVDRAVRQVGNWSSVKFSDPVIHSCIEAMGGWELLGRATNDEWKWKRKEFENLYPIMAKRKEHPEMLLGMLDSQNIAEGFSLKPSPVMVDGKDRVRIDQGQGLLLVKKG
jgi:hypothetical protein